MFGGLEHRAGGEQRRDPGNGHDGTVKANGLGGEFHYFLGGRRHIRDVLPARHFLDLFEKCFVLPEFGNAAGAKLAPPSLG